MALEEVPGATSGSKAERLGGARVRAVELSSGVWRGGACPGAPWLAGSHVCSFLVFIVCRALLGSLGASAFISAHRI